MDGQAIRRNSEPRPEFVALGLLAEEASHGYALYRRFEASLSGLWRISESQMYSILKRLEEKGLVVGAAPEKGRAASYRVLSLGAEGRAAFEAWLSEPTAPSPRALRLEFITRLRFASARGPDVHAGIVASQKRAVESAIGRLSRSIASESGERRPGSAQAGAEKSAALARSLSLCQLRAALTWLEGL